MKRNLFSIAARIDQKAKREKGGENKVCDANRMELRQIDYFFEKKRRQQINGAGPK